MILLNFSGWRLALGALACMMLAACGSPPKPTPAAIGNFKVLQPLTPSWVFKFSAVNQLNQSLAVVNDKVAIAAADGAVAVVHTDNGKLVWKHDIGTRLLSGAGFNGEQLAVVTVSNELVVLNEGKEIWRKRLRAQSYTNPLVAGGRVFVLLADRSVAAFDALTGQFLWTQQRPGEPLVLKQNGVLLPFQNTLIAGLGGRLVAMNPDNGQIIWDVAMANPRGVNDLERLVDLVATASRVNNTVCVRAFQAQVGCVDVTRGALLWNRASVGVQGVDGDAKLLVGSESNGVVRAWSRAAGERAWDTDRLKYRELTSPLVTAKGVVLGDEGGWLYVLSASDGSLLNRIQTSSSGFASAPTPLAQGGFVVLTRNGQLLAYQLP
ncbi:MAG: outer membrane protein assembly factor BamB [Burkholderiaceae bacterium]|jgi:outer membrane assembly lipoprotein YfgL|nr:outer membrane protein assembly factor BamB [Burkholderiaceae bacterium]